MTPRLRRSWFAAVAFVLAMGLGNLAIWLLDGLHGGGWWSIDLALVLDAGGRWAAGGSPYEDARFLYPPLAAVVAAPLAGVPFPLVSLAWAAAKVAAIAAGALILTRGQSRFVRVLAVAGALGSLPFLHDLQLGNANALLVAAVVPALVVPGIAGGLALGLAVALFAKPLLVPILLWLLVWRPAALVGAAAVAAGATVLGLALAGPGAYGAWLGALGEGTDFASSFAGNHGVTALAPALWLPVAIATSGGLLAVLALRGPAAGLVWAVASGILIAPYAGTYSALPLLLALPVLLRQGPGLRALALLLVALSPLLTTFPLPFLAATVLLAGLAVREPVAERFAFRAEAGRAGPFLAAVR